MAGFLSLLRRLYLSVYNWTLFAGWGQVLYFALNTLKESGHEHVYDAVEWPLQLSQTAAVLEDWLDPPFTATLPQIGSRLFVTWAILWSFPETRTHLLVSYLVINWSITEVFFLWNEGGLWFYTFMTLVDQGSEKYCIRIPNKLNFSFDFFCFAILVLGFYVPGSPHMYTYMLSQQKKTHSKSKRE